MSTNAPPSGPDPTDHATNATKPLEDAAKALGVLFTHCSQADPSGEACSVVSEMLKGLGAIKQRLVEGPPPPPPTPPPIQNGGPFDQAGMSLMQDLQQSPPPGPPPGLGG